MPRTTTKRRTRYFIILTHKTTGARRVTSVLAYSRAWVDENIPPRFPGYAVKITTTNPEYIKIKRAATGWRLLPDWQTTARSALGLEFPILVRTHGRVGGTNANHTLKVDAAGNPYHNVMVKDYVPAEQANESLWHELQHCRQAEDAVKASTAPPLRAWANVNRVQRQWPYRSRPIEVEARRVASQMKDIKLVG